MKKYFTTGEFATLCKVTKQTLFHYDRIGILCPKIIGENGYRYYSYHQLDDFALIYSLRDLGMPLKGIKEYLDRRSPEELTRLLEEQKKAVEEKVAKLRWMGEYLEFKLKITTDAKAVEIGTVKEEEQAEERLICTKYTGSTEDADLEAAIVKHMNYCDELGLNRVYDIGVMFDRREVEGAELINYAYIYSKAERKKKLPYHLKEKGRYLTHYDYGYDREDENLHKVLDFAREKGYKVGEYFYEDVMIDDLSVKSYDEHIVKLSIKLL